MKLLQENILNMLTETSKKLIALIVLIVLFNASCSSIEYRHLINEENIIRANKFTFERIEIKGDYIDIEENGTIFSIVVAYTFEDESPRFGDIDSIDNEEWSNDSDYEIIMDRFYVSRIKLYENDLPLRQNYANIVKGFTRKLYPAVSDEDLKPLGDYEDYDITELKIDTHTVSRFVYRPKKDNSIILFLAHDSHIYFIMSQYICIGEIDENGDIYCYINKHVEDFIRFLLDNR